MISLYHDYRKLKEYIHSVTSSHLNVYKLKIKNELYYGIHNITHYNFYLLQDE